MSSKLDRLPESREFWTMAGQLAMSGARQLRDQLGLSETEFRRISCHLNETGRSSYLYRVLDEVQKAGCSILHWTEFLGDVPKPEAVGSPHEQINRVIVEEVVDSQNFRCRKLTETLVELILFSTTDKELYYQDYLSIRELNDYVDAQRDREKFYGRTNRNCDESIKFYLDLVRKLESRGVDPKRRWYLKQPEGANKGWTKNGAQLSSFRWRYTEAIRICDESEFICIGRSYLHAYGTSRDIHFSAHDTSAGFVEEEMLYGVDRCALLTLALVARCVKTLGLAEDPAFRPLMRLTALNEVTRELVSDLKEQKVTAGDYVVASGTFGRVTDVSKSSQGFFSYEVEFLEHAPIPSIRRDWFAAFEVRVAVLRKAIMAHIEPNLTQLVVEGKGVSDEKLQRWVDEGALNVFKTLKAARRARREAAVNDSAVSSPANNGLKLDSAGERTERPSP